MGVILSAIGYVAGYLAILFEAICLACGLYYAAELAEEYASATKKVIAWAVAIVMALHVALGFEKFPLPLLAGGLACHGMYALLLRDFPNVEIFSVKFGLSLCALFADHCLWFQYLYARALPVRHIFHTMALFFLLVWFVPFALFVSLSVNDNVLPSSSMGMGSMGKSVSHGYSASGSSIDTSLGSSVGSSLYGGYASDATAAPGGYGLSSPYSSSSGGGGKGTARANSRATAKKGGIRGLLDSVNAHIAPGIAKSV